VIQREIDSLLHEYHQDLDQPKLKGYLPK